MKIRVTHRVRLAVPADYTQAQEEVRQRLAATFHRRPRPVYPEPTPQARATGCRLLLLFSALTLAAMIYAACRWGR